MYVHITGYPISEYVYSGENHMSGINRRDFLRKSGAGLAVGITSGLWSDLLAAGEVPVQSQTLFQDRFGVSREDMKKILEIALSKGGDFSELFFEYKISNSVRMEEDIIRESSEDILLGVGLRVLKGDQTGYGYTSELTMESMKKTALTAAAIAAGGGGTTPVTPLSVKESGHQVYDMSAPFTDVKLGGKIALVKEGYGAAQSYDKRITKVQAVLLDQIQYVTIANSEGLLVSDVRPMAIMYVSTTAEENGTRNTGFKSSGGRVGLSHFTDVETPTLVGRKSAEEAITLLGAIDPPAGEQPVVLSSYQSGVMIHEAVGHPLEADANRKKTSIMWDKLGKQIANPIVTIYDDPTIPYFRGSLNVDDEGTETKKTMLIEKGKLVGYLQDRLSARVMGMELNGHGRRESYKNNPVPRMANTVLGKGDANPEDIIKSVKKGFYAVTYQGGQVSDAGKFTFSVNMGYLIEDGKLTKPVKNATLIGTNVQILNEVEMIGNDTDFFLGTCGKDGQSAAVTAGTPTLKIRTMTVGGRS
jgi:TldD protein